MTEVRWIDEDSVLAAVRSADGGECEAVTQRELCDLQHAWRRAFAEPYRAECGELVPFFDDPDHLMLAFRAHGSRRIPFSNLVPLLPALSATDIVAVIWYEGAVEVPGNCMSALLAELYRICQSEPLVGYIVLFCPAAPSWSALVDLGEWTGIMIDHAGT